MVELRGLSTELRASSDDGGKRIAGYVATFGTITEIGGPVSAGGGFKEKIDPRAFDACLQGNPDVRCLAQHDPSQILGRTRSGTLRLAVNNVGLRFECQLPASTLGDNIWTSVKRGDVSGASIGFQTDLDDWPDKDTRVLKQVTLFDVGPVTFPAYTQTSVSIRSAAGTLERHRIAWYRGRGLHLPLTTQQEMRSKVRQIRQELGDADDDDNECSCECTACRDGSCGDCSCGDMTACTGTNCSSDGSDDCHCFTTREVAGRMRRPEGKTLYPVDAGPLWRTATARSSVGAATVQREASD